LFGLTLISRRIRRILREMYPSLRKKLTEGKLLSQVILELLAFRPTIQFIPVSRSWALAQLRGTRKGELPAHSSRPKNLSAFGLKFLQTVRTVCKNLGSGAIFPLFSTFLQENRSNSAKPQPFPATTEHHSLSEDL
jgi:hypothetical protein